ncbi:hypothetical protein SPHINGO361_130063 [Sphingomonas sp. EC-HK361]|uniref:hypothetical protein n=1 Tax=Sphingomonas sp. EC-HK361 TaxID=2038397 RepID=UPI0012538D35|nr:hypothetical protein [Sphingomonas sp. EC-HK361]VVT12981.1 hypothetical protein SPHINGO361_130063 [Sphingomonas sp. EC-HK361]
MSGTAKVIAITVLAVFALAMFNLSIWRRMQRALAAARGGAGREDRPDVMGNQVLVHRKDSAPAQAGAQSRERRGR